jgi:hypothetical protein
VQRENSPNGLGAVFNGSGNAEPFDSVDSVGAGRVGQQLQSTERKNLPGGQSEKSVRGQSARGVREFTLYTIDTVVRLRRYIHNSTFYYVRMYDP